MFRNYKPKITVYTPSPPPHLHTSTPPHLHRVIAEERMKAKSLESELGQSDKAAGGLQADLTATGQELQQALDLCSQHEELLEERNQELCSLEAKNR